MHLVYGSPLSPGDCRQIHLSHRWLCRLPGHRSALSQRLILEARSRLSQAASQDQGRRSDPLRFGALKLDRAATVGRLATESNVRKIPGPYPQLWGGDRSDPCR